MSVVSCSTTSTTAYKVTADTTGTLVLQTGSTPTTAVTIDTSQNVGIGNTNPNGYKLMLGDGSSSRGRIYINGATGGNYPEINFDDTMNSSGRRWQIFSTSGSLVFNDTTGGERARIDSSGNLLVGTTSVIGSGKLSVSFAGATANAIETQDSGTNSGAAFFSCRNSGGTQIGSITRVGTTNAVIFNTTSDQRLKSNIDNAAPILEKLMQIEVRQYDWTEGDLHQDYGFIAQELEPILSGIVTKGKTEEDMWQMDYSRLTPHLVKAIQEQQAIIETLTTRISALEAK